jgi:hypothetical protein
LEPELEPGSSLGNGTRPGTCPRVGTRILENNIFLGKKKLESRANWRLTSIYPLVLDWVTWA